MSTTRKAKHYTARWAQPGHPSLGNVSFDASNDSVAKRQADKIAREIGLTRTPRTITEGGRVVEVLSTGRSE